jgi:hypothetical protein
VNPTTREATHQWYQPTWSMLPLRSSSTPRLLKLSAWLPSTDTEILNDWYASPRSPIPIATFVRRPHHTLSR